MKIRFILFILAILLLPWLALSHPAAVPDMDLPGEATAAVINTSMLLALYILFINHYLKRLTRSAPLSIQRGFFIRLSMASAASGWLLCYLNWFFASWSAQQGIPYLLQALIYTPLFALLAPAVQITRHLLATLLNTKEDTVTSAGSRIPSYLLLPLALAGLSYGAAHQLFWLFWISPLLLLASLQQLWGVRSILNGGLKPVMSAALCSFLIGNLALAAYQSNAQLHLPGMLAVQAGCAVFGLFCLQLSWLIDSAAGLNRQNQSKA